MTHPDILKMEKDGCLDPIQSFNKVGECHYCGENLYDDSVELVESIDGKFCHMDCCLEFYEIHHI